MIGLSTTFLAETSLKRRETGKRGSKSFQEICLPKGRMGVAQVGSGTERTRPELNSNPARAKSYLGKNKELLDETIACVHNKGGKKQYELHDGRRQRRGGGLRRARLRASPDPRH